MLELLVEKTLTLNANKTAFLTEFSMDLKSAGFSWHLLMSFFPPLFLFRWLLGSPVSDISHRLGDICEVVTYP